MNDRYSEARSIKESIPPVPANDRCNRSWREVRSWAETHSSEIVRVYDMVSSKTVTMKILGLRSMGPFHTACLKAGRLDLIPQSYRSRSRARSTPQQVSDVGIKQQMAGLVAELRRTRKDVNRLFRRLESVAVDPHHRKK